MISFLIFFLFLLFLHTLTSNRFPDGSGALDVLEVTDIGAYRNEWVIDERFYEGGEDQKPIALGAAIPGNSLVGIVEVKEEETHQHGEAVNHREDDERRAPIDTTDKDKPNHKDVAAHL